MTAKLIEGVDFPAYLADPAPEPSLTSSLIRSLSEVAPRKVWEHTTRLNDLAANESKTIFDIGSAAHALIVGGGEPLVVIEAADYRTKAARELRDKAHADGKTPLLRKDFARVKAMADVAQAQFEQNQDLGALTQHPPLREATLMWQDGKVWNRCRPDLYYQLPKAQVVVHYKTTNGLVPMRLPRLAANLGWGSIAAHYEAGVKALTGDSPDQYFAIQDTEPPYLCIVTRLDGVFVELGRQRRARALFLWEWCLERKLWPGYSIETVELECPVWHERDLIEQRDREEAVRHHRRSDLVEFGAVL